MLKLLVLAVLLATGERAYAQSCENGGAVNGSACACPPGFGGATCSDLACGGTLFDGTDRKYISNSSASAFANLTSSSCSCESGWTGTNCNVCQSTSACQTGFSSSAAGKASAAAGATGSDVTSGQNGQNETIVCNATPRVYAAGEMSCDVQNPTVQAAFPGDTTLTILRTLNGDLSPLPNLTSFGASGSIYTQLFYNGVEQFYCSASACTQSAHSSGELDWACNNVACACLTGTSFCGGGVLDLSATIDALSGALSITCAAPAADGSVACAFHQGTIDGIFGNAGLGLGGCRFGECVRQAIVDATAPDGPDAGGGGGNGLSGGVIAGLAVVGGLIALALALLAFGCVRQKQARKAGGALGGGKAVGVKWEGVSYAVVRGRNVFERRKAEVQGEKVILDGVSGNVAPGQMMAILGPSGAGKTTLVEILSGKDKAGRSAGTVTFPSATATATRASLRVGFVPQQDVLPAMLTVREALMFAARLRMPEAVPAAAKRARVDEVLRTLGLMHIADVRIGDGERRGVSGGEMRRVSIGLELVASPDVLILDEPTSGLDSVSAANVANLLHDVAHDAENPIAVIASIHQPSSKLYQIFDRVMVLSQGHALYSGPGGLAPARDFVAHGVPPLPEGYNVADYLLEVASDAPVQLYQNAVSPSRDEGSSAEKVEYATGSGAEVESMGDVEKGLPQTSASAIKGKKATYSATFLTQFEALAGREWKILRRDKTLFLTHVGIASVLGVFCGGLYFRTGITIAGFQSRVGCLFFLGALVAFSCLSALYNIVATRPLFVRERSNAYYSPAAWLLSRVVFDLLPLRIIPIIILSTITYWMVGLAGDAAHFFKFLFVLVLYTIAMTLFNFLLGCLFRNGGIAILLSALSALYQMTFAGFFVHIGDIPPVLRWLQWLAPLKYLLEALSVNEINSGLMIVDTLQGVPVDTSASLIMQLLFGFQTDAYYRDVLVLFAFIVGFGAAVVGTVWVNVRERR